jgi:nitroreductase
MALAMRERIAILKDFPTSLNYYIIGVRKMTQKYFLEVLTNRRSVRSFKDEEIPIEKIKQIISAAFLAPSGSNIKNYDFIIIKNKDIKNNMKKVVEEKIEFFSSKMKSATAKKMFLDYSKYFTFFSKAPVVVAVMMKDYDSLSARILKKYENNNEYMKMAGVQNVAAAIENMLLTCAYLELGACWMTGPLIAKNELEKILDIQNPYELTAIIPIGIPKSNLTPNKFPEITNLKILD